MGSVELKVVATLGDGMVETVRLHCNMANRGEASVQIHGIDDERGEIAEQLRRAKELANLFFSLPWVRPAVRFPLDQSALTATFEEGGTRHGPSFGLSFLAGCLALGFNAPLRRSSLLSAGLGDEETREIAGPAIVPLLPVGDVVAKLAAASSKDIVRFFVFPEQESALLKYEQRYYRGEPGCCLPCVLPERISMSALVSLALDTSALLDRLVKEEDTEAFILYLLGTDNETSDEWGFPIGIGNAIASLRADNRLSNIPHLPHAAPFLQVAPTTSGEGVLATIVPRLAHSCSLDEHMAELLMAAVSSNSASDDHTARQDVLQKGYLGWVEQEPVADVTWLCYATSIADLAERVLPDPEATPARIGRLLLGSLRLICDRAHTAAEADDLQTASRVVMGIQHSGLTTRLINLRPDWRAEICSRLEELAQALRRTNFLGADELASTLIFEARTHDLAQLVEPLLRKEREPLRFIFSLAPDGTSGDEAERFTRFNDLSLTIDGPHRTRLVIPSPCLLFEDAEQQHKSYCLRTGFSKADSTINRFPVNDAEVVRQLFAHPLQPTVIGFQLEKRHGSDIPSIYWSPRLHAFPPAIDTQVLVAAMAQYGSDQKPTSVADVGCGTGFIGVVAAHLWPSLSELHLIEVDKLALAGALQNVRFSLGDMPSLRVVPHPLAFQKYKGPGVDVLLCNPPYLPNRPLPVAGIELATNGTALLEDVVRRGSRLAREVYLVFSAIAWPEFEHALTVVPNAYSRIEVLRRSFVPFRIPWLEPIPPDDANPQRPFQRRQSEYDRKRKYYERILLSPERGMIDLNDHGPWTSYVERTQPSLPGGVETEFAVLTSKESVEQSLRAIDEDSRGYRFWHEVRVLRLVKA